MVKLLVLIVLVVFAVWLIRRALRGPERKDPPAVKEGDLVACARCGVHLPRSEARQSEGALYCSEEHARLGKP
jgi:uncharacterized protein